MYVSLHVNIIPRPQMKNGNIARQGRPPATTQGQLLAQQSHPVELGKPRVALDGGGEAAAPLAEATRLVGTQQADQEVAALVGQIGGVLRAGRGGARERGCA